MVTLEQVLDKIAESIIQSPNVNISPDLVQEKNIFKKHLQILYKHIRVLL